MNLLQSFIAECNRQTRAINQEQVQINGSLFWGTFGDPQMIPELERQGHTFMIAKILVSDRSQYATPPASLQKLIRVQGNTEYFIQMVDTKDPVVFTFMLVDRQA